jgi:hypothetical protein
MEITMFTEFRYDSDGIKTLVAENAATVRSERGLSDYTGFAISVFRKRLKQNGPIRYLDYGPYWWAVKDVLNRAGEDLGSDDDAELREAYRGETDAETLAMADLYREQYLKTQFLGSRQVVLTDTGELWTIMDDDMEEKAMASA